MKSKASGKASKVTRMKKDAKFVSFARFWHLPNGLSEQLTDQLMDGELLIDAWGGTYKSMSLATLFFVGT